MFACLVCRSLALEATQLEAVALARRCGFAAVEARADELAALSEDALGRLLDDMAAHGLRFGLSGLPIDMRREETRFADGLRQLPRFARVLQRCSVTRLGCSIVPAHDELSYAENFRQHVARCRAIAEVLAGHGISFGLEYCATPALRRGRRHEFIHSLPQMRELIAAIAAPNLGLVLDSWHWWIGGGSHAELATLHREEIVSVDVNDAPKGIAPDALGDRQRELPGATGVIDLCKFLGALKALGYDGPLRAEPFEFPEHSAEADTVCRRAHAALQQVLSAVEKS
jgi:sugar phosphate isomerase/epimerase